MKITFNVNFHTVWGQRLCLVGSVPELGSWNTALAKDMNFTENGNWQVEVDINTLEKEIEYRYFLVANGKIIFEEWKNHSVIFDEQTQSYKLYDYWQNSPHRLAYYTSAFIKGFFAHKEKIKVRQKLFKKRLSIKISMPRVEKGQLIAITGNQDVLGNWNPQKSVFLDNRNFPVWQIDLDAETIHYPLEYKFLLLDSNKQVICWEEGENRILALPIQQNGETVIISGINFRNNLPDWKCAGSVIPLFSLRSEDSYGIGDFRDLHLLVDWGEKTHQRIIQLLPVNDTTMTHSWMDSYPYNAISIYALHPVYISLLSLGQLKDTKRMEYYKKKQIELNLEKSVDYDQVIQYKMSYCLEFFEEQGQDILSSAAYQEFYRQNEHWLLPYAAYSYLRDLNHTSDFRQWVDYSVYDEISIRQLCTDGSKAHHDIEFHFFIQFVLHQQFRDAVDYAHEKGIVLKGDLPIGISPTSVEAWTEPRYFNMNGQAGAPPDDFSDNGQNWGFPTYNWDVMAKDNYDWWKRRFKKLEDYFDCLRIDHILGFFRIWEVPKDYVEGLCGHFNPALPLSVEEIEQYGLEFNESQFTIPQISDENIQTLFGDQTEIAKSAYLAQLSAGRYGLKPFCNTQQKIEHLLGGKTDEASMQLKKGLFAIANDVLFLRDPLKTDCFHPRISAYKSYVYKELKESDRYAFDQLYWDFFYHRHNDFWRVKALERLTPLIDSTDMLICGEDLGMIPDSVPDVMRKLQILSLEVERMPKTVHSEFSDLENLPYLSVCTPSTHDMSTLRGWWRENTDKTQLYYNRVLHHEGMAPVECSGQIATEIIQNHLGAPSMLTIIPIQDWMAMDEDLRNPDIDAERINIPSRSNFFWNYRMHLTLNSLLESKSLNKKISEMIDHSGRY